MRKTAAIGALLLAIALAGCLYPKRHEERDKRRLECRIELWERGVEETLAKKRCEEEA